MGYQDNSNDKLSITTLHGEDKTKHRVLGTETNNYVCNHNLLPSWLENWSSFRSQECLNRGPQSTMGGPTTAMVSVVKARSGSTIWPRECFPLAGPPVKIGSFKWDHKSPGLLSTPLSQRATVAPTFSAYTVTTSSKSLSQRELLLPQPSLCTRS